MGAACDDVADVDVDVAESVLVDGGDEVFEVLQAGTSAPSAVAAARLAIAIAGVFIRVPTIRSLLQPVSAQ